MPDSQPSARRVSVVGVLIVGGIALLGVVLVFNGVKMLVERANGERAEATVTRCVDSGTSRNQRTDCVGTWRTAAGEVKFGTVQGATSDQVGKTISVTIKGDRAYSRDVKLPVMLVVLGLLPLALGLALLRGMLKTPAPATPGPPPA